jgi:hypothetical protein
MNAAGIILAVALLFFAPLLAAEKSPGAPPASNNGAWTSLFDGKSLRGWERTDFSTLGDVRVENPFRGGSGAIVVALAGELNGVNRARFEPKTNYEVSLEAMRVAGHDFFCGLTFPVGETAATFVVGGWSGSVVGISCIDGADASVNETTRTMDFDNGRWYRVRVRVTPAKIECWIDETKVADVALAGRKISLRPGEIGRSRPFGLAAWHTSAAWRDIRLRRLH